MTSSRCHQRQTEGTGFISRKDTAGQRTVLWLYVPCGMWLRGKDSFCVLVAQASGHSMRWKRRMGAADRLDITHFPNAESGWSWQLLAC